MKETVTVLIADDDEDDRVLTRDALDSSDLPKTLRFVASGAELLDYLRRESAGDEEAQPRPGLILLDLNMPGMGGCETLERIKSIPHFRSIPIVVLTGSNFARDVEQAYALGASSYIRKPSSFSGLVKSLDTALHYWLDVVELPPPPGPI